MKEEEKIRHREKGLTFFEILVVTIIGLLAALVGPRPWKRISGGKQVAAKAQIELFGTALDAFRLDIGRYPTTEEGLKALREKPSIKLQHVDTDGQSPWHSALRAY